MKIAFELTQKDYMIFYKKYLRNNSLLFQPRIFLIIAVGIGLVLFSDKYMGTTIIFNEARHNPLIFEISNVILLLAFLIGFVYIIRGTYLRRIQKSLNENSHFLGSKEIALIDGKLIWRTPYATTEYSRNSFISVEDSDNYIYLHLGKQSALIIPKSVLGDNEQLLEWFG